MEIATSQSLSRLWRLALIGTFTAFAWIVVALVLGLGSGHAHADDGGDDSLLGAVTSAVDATAASVSGTVSTATSGVAQVANAVVDVAPAPVQQPVREVVRSVGAAIATASEPVVEVVSGGVVGSVATPVVEVVSQVPVVGDIASGIGLDDAVSDLGHTVDRTLGDVADAIAGTGAGLGQPPAGGLPELPGLPGVPTDPAIPVEGHPLPALDVALPGAAAAAAPGAASALSLLLTAYELRSAANGSAVTSAASTDARGTSAPAGGLCPPLSTTSGPAGAGSGAWALVALGPLVALRAWVRRAGPQDEHAPPAPAASTDVSPD